MPKIKWTSSELKELILGALAFLWGVLLLLPGNSLLPYGGYDLYRFYADDWLWGSYLVIAGLIILCTAMNGYIRLRKLIHASLWMFWLGIAFLVFIRTQTNGISATDILLVLPFVALAFLHAAVYTRLAVVL